MFAPVSIVIAAALLVFGLTRTALLAQDRRAFRTHREQQ